MPNKLIIAVSGKQLSGKDTAAKLILENFSYFKRIGLGDAIKLEYGKRKNLNFDEIEENKSKYRRDLIDLGNEGRAIDPDFWIKKILDYADCIIVPDIRVKHEYDFFRSAGAIMVRVQANEKIRAKRGALAAKDDKTECALDEITDWDFVIENNGTYEEFIRNLQPLFNFLKSKQA